MRNYVFSSYITGILTLMAIIIVLYLHYLATIMDSEFWVNICLAIFGSSLLALITSVVGYFSAKRKTLEEFLSSTKSLLKYINNYSINWDLNKKVEFFILYYKMDKSLWNQQYGDIKFMFDYRKSKRNFIYNKIYKPLLDFNQEVADNSFDFQEYNNAINKNDAVISKKIKDIESLFIEKIHVKNNNDDYIKKSIVKYKLFIT